HKLSSVSRPSEMSHWIKRKRDYTKPPEIENVCDYADTFRTWWSGLQPSWRGTEWPLTRSIVAGETWEGVRKGGANGFVIVLILLAWWA
ncbi:hypothetical protein BV25DRAFT_1789869, partial [Artomyces pyxidatus]